MNVEENVNSLTGFLSPFRLGWPHRAWFAVSLGWTRLWSTCSVWLVFCDCGSHSVGPLMDQGKKLMEASWWESLWGTLGLVLMGRAMLRQSLIQFSADGQGCVPSLLFDLRLNYSGNEDNGHLLQKVPCMQSSTECPQPCSRPLLTHASAGDAAALTGRSGSSLVGSLLLSPADPRLCRRRRGAHRQVWAISCGVAAPFSCWPMPLPETPGHSQAGLGRSLVGSLPLSPADPHLCWRRRGTHRRVWAISRGVATPFSCWPTPLPETPGHSQASLGQSLVGSLLLSPGSWCTRFVWALPVSLVGMGFDSKHDFTPPTVLLELLLCPWMWGIFFLVGFNIFLSTVVQQRAVIL